jgi:hypothetical protein
MSQVYKVRNIGDETFKFEGVVIPKGEESGELSLETYQRLLALYYGFKLMPVEDAAKIEEESVTSDSDEKDGVEDKDEDEVKETTESSVEDSDEDTEEEESEEEEVETPSPKGRRGRPKKSAEPES